MAKIVLDPITSGYQSTSQVNNNNADISTNLNDKILYRNNPDGEDNEMFNLLDMNSNKIINLPQATSSGEPVSLGQLLDIVGEVVGDSGSGTGGINLPYVSNSETILPGTDTITFSDPINLSVFSISGLSADSHRLIEDADYELDLNTNTIHLFNTYPEGTTLVRYREQAPTAADSNLHAVTGTTTVADASGVVALNAFSGTIGTFLVIPSGDITNLSIANAPIDSGLSYNPRIIVQSGGAFTVVMDPSIKFESTPTFSAVVGERDHLDLNTVDNGTTYDAVQIISALG